MALCYRQGIPGYLDVDLPEYRKLLLHAAQEGYSEAQWLLAEGQAQGREGFKKDPVEANKWMKLAADQGNLNAIIGYADFHEQGIGVPKDLSKSFALLKRAHELGYAGAGARIGKYYWEGLVVRRDDETAYHYFSQAAEAGDPLGLYMLGECFLQVRGLPGLKSPDGPGYAKFLREHKHTAVYHYILAAELGHANAFQRLLNIRDEKLTESQWASRRRTWRRDPTELFKQYAR